MLSMCSEYDDQKGYTYPAPLLASASAEGGRATRTKREAERAARVQTEEEEDILEFVLPPPSVESD